MNGLIVFLMLVGLVCVVTYGYRVLTDNAFVSSKYNAGLTRVFLVLGVVAPCIAGLVAIMEEIG